MKSLFLRLYFLLFLSLVGSAIGLDYLYSRYHIEDDQSAELTRVWQAMNGDLTRQNAASKTGPHNLTGVPTVAAVKPGVWLHLSELHWPDSSVTVLLRERATTLQDSNGNRYFYGLDPDSKRVFVMPLLAASTDDRHWLWLLAYYGTVALVVFFWLKPLIRDIDKLRRSVEALDLPTAELDLPIHQRSALTPVATALRGLRRHTADLMALQRDIVNAVSHDIRTPLARIRFALAMLPVEPNGKLSSGIQADLTEIELLVNEMLQYAEFEHKLPMLNRKPIHLQTFVNTVVARYQHHHAVQFDLRIPDTAELMFDEACLHRVLQNLLDNALRYARNRIQIQWQSDSAGQQLSVEDDGPGLPEPEGLELSAEFTSAGEAHGYGLGLAIVKKICLWHGGQLRLEDSVSLGGASVAIFLPR